MIETTDTLSPSQVNNSRGIARITFRVRCETLGHGETVFLYADDEKNESGRPIPLYTTQSAYPWYVSNSTIPIHVPRDAEKSKFTYRYGVFRAGVFHRWEQPSDGPSEITRIEVEEKDSEQSSSNSSDTNEYRHELPLRLLTVEELYTVNDVLGVTNGHPDIDHIRFRANNAIGELTMLHSTSHQDSYNMLRSTSRQDSFGNKRSSSPHLSGGGTPKSKSETTKKKVGFAPQPPPYHASASSECTSPSTKARKTPVHLDSTDGLVVASVFLPVHLHRTSDGQWSANWDHEALLSMESHLRVTRVGVVKWRGWHGNFGKQGSPEEGVPIEERERVEACLKDFNCVPVWIDPKLFGEMYNGFCKGVLWPVLHNVTSVYSARSDGVDSRGISDDSFLRPSKSSSDDSRRVSETLSSVSSKFSAFSNDDVAMGAIHGDGGEEASLWAAYTKVNREFGNVIVQCFNEGDMVWIHGFHLLILPSFLTRRIPMAKMGIFLHTPFPSSEIFRTLWCREDLLRGMLNADQVGFHLFEYARHFLTCSRRLLGLKYGMIPDGSGGHNLAIETNGRNVAVTSIHAGVDPTIIEQVLNHRSTLEKAKSIRKQFRGKVIFGAIDRMESLKGIPLKMLGLERFLNRCPEWVGKIVLVQVGISAFERGDDYLRTKSEVLTMVANINRTWPGTVQFQECSESKMRLPQRMALMSAADVIIVSPIRDGLNLIPLEFTIAHESVLRDKSKNIVGGHRKRGLCILSEFSSCTRVMRGALHVNPWKISELANSFHQALNMTNEERLRRLSTALEFATRVTTQRWAHAVLLDLKAVHKNMDVGKYSGAGLGLGYRILGMDRGFTSLDVGMVGKAYKKSRARLILMDYGGTILSNDNLDNLSRFQVATKSRAYTMPTPRMIQTLKDLCSDKRNIVFVVSGKERHSLTSTLDDIPNLGLAAEHGMFISWPDPSIGKKRIWETLVPEQDTSWRSIVITVMEVYTSRTHGSYIEETEMKVLWQYRDADPEFGYLQARELEDHLSNVLRNFSVDILHGGMEEGGYVEVRPKGVNKGVVALHILKSVPKISTWERIDFTLVMGDDHCDEPMLSVMRQVGRRVHDSRCAKNHQPLLPPLPATVTQVDVSSCDDFVSSRLETFTTTVGKKPSAAANYVHDVDEVQEFLDGLVKLSARVHKFNSSIDLREMGKTPLNILNFNLPDQAGNVSQFLLRGDNLDDSDVDGGIKVRSMSMGNFLNAGVTKAEPTRISANLNEFLGTIEDEDEAIFI